jgi:hypothetical protein
LTTSLAKALLITWILFVVVVLDVWMPKTKRLQRIARLIFDSCSHLLFEKINILKMAVETAMMTSKARKFYYFCKNFS